MIASYPAQICNGCGLQHGRRDCGIATWYPGTCDICGEHAFVTEPRDFGHLKPGWEALVKTAKEGKQ